VEDAIAGLLSWLSIHAAFFSAHGSAFTAPAQRDEHMEDRTCAPIFTWYRATSVERAAARTC